MNETERPNRRIQEARHFGTEYDFAPAPRSAALEGGGKLLRSAN